MDEKQVSEFLFEMSDKARETTRSLFGRDRFYEGFASGINVAATTVKMRQYEKSSPGECAHQTLLAATMADIIDNSTSKVISDD